MLFVVYLQQFASSIIFVIYVDFVFLVGSHKHALRSCFGNAFLQTVCQQHKLLVRVVAQEAPLSSQLHARILTHKVFSKSWALFGSRFKELRQLVAGLATVMPTSSRVDGDFSLICYHLLWPTLLWKELSMLSSMMIFRLLHPSYTVLGERNVHYCTIAYSYKDAKSIKIVT